MFKISSSGYWLISLIYCSLCKCCLYHEPVKTDWLHSSLLLTNVLSPSHECPCKCVSIRNVKRYFNKENWIELCTGSCTFILQWMPVKFFILGELQIHCMDWHLEDALSATDFRLLDLEPRTHLKQVNALNCFNNWVGECLHSHKSFTKLQR